MQCCAIPVHTDNGGVIYYSFAPLDVKLHSQGQWFQHIITSIKAVHTSIKRYRFLTRMGHRYSSNIRKSLNWQQLRLDEKNRNVAQDVIQIDYIRTMNLLLPAQLCMNQWAHRLLQTTPSTTATRAQLVNTCYSNVPMTYLRVYIFQCNTYSSRLHILALNWLLKSSGGGSAILSSAILSELSRAAAHWLVGHVRTLNYSSLIA